MIMYWKSFLTSSGGGCTDHKMPSIRLGIICAVVLAVVVSTLPMTTANANECHSTCLDCSKHDDQNMCTTCPTNSSNYILEPPKDCSMLFQNCSSNCSDICSSKKQSCECILETPECEDCRMDMMGKCVKECAHNLKEDKIETSFNQSSPVCRVCDGVYLGFCFERYIIWFLAVPIAIFIVLLLIVIVVIVCMCRLRHNERGCWAKSETGITSSHQQNKPAPPPNSRAVQRRSTDVDDFDHTGESDANALQLQNEVEETTTDDIYGNMDEHGNVLLGQAPLAEQNSLRDRQKMMLPHERLIHQAQAQHQDVEEEQEALYDNEDSIRRGAGAGYIKMKGNVEIEMARMPPHHPHSPPSEPEPIDEPIYGNDPQLVQSLGRHGTVPARRAPDIPTNKKHSSTFPKGIESTFINEGYDDENPEDDYPDFPTNDETFDSMPAYPAPAPPIQKQDSIPSYPAPLPPAPGEEFDSLPSLPPPGPPTNKPGPKPPKRTTSNVGTTGMAAIQEFRLNNQSRETSPANQPTSMSDLQRQLQASLQVRGEPGGRGPGVLNPKPGGGALKPPGKASTLPLDAVFSKPTAADDDDSEDSQDEYEIVEDPDKPATNPSPTHQADTSGRKPLPLPQDPSKRPKLAPPTAAKKNKSPPPVPLSKPLSPPAQKPQDFEQEVYEVMEDEANNAPDRPRLPTPGEPIEEELYEPINADNDSGLVYEVTDGSPGRLPVPPPVAQKPALIEDDVYQNEPVMKHPSMNTGRYRNLPADPEQKARMAKVDPYSLRMTRKPPP